MQLLKNRGVQFPKLNLNDGFIKSITDSDSNVKKKHPDITYTKQFKDCADDKEKQQFKRWFGNSKVVDENGKPLVVYHQTGYGFIIL